PGSVNTRITGLLVPGSDEAHSGVHPGIPTVPRAFSGCICGSPGHQWAPARSRSTREDCMRAPTPTRHQPDTQQQGPADVSFGPSVGRSVPAWVVLALVCLGQFMVVLDISIVNVALPSIQADLGFSLTGLQWVVNAYTLTF